MFTLKQTLKSKIDRTVKLVYLSDRGEIAEVSYINKDDGKDILCVPTQTSCRMGCRFCHLTGLDVPVRSFSGNQIAWLVGDAEDQLGLPRQHTLLISFMGAGEPLNNVQGVIDAALEIEHDWAYAYKQVRFAVASIIPSVASMVEYIKQVREWELDFKFHLSLHSSSDSIRADLIPRALNVADSLELVSEYVARTGNQAEVHYTLIDGVNDRPVDACDLAQKLRLYGLQLKILHFSERDGALDLRRSQREDDFASRVREMWPHVEVYDPPGRDVGASCGMFLTNVYGGHIDGR